VDAVRVLGSIKGETPGEKIGGPIEALLSGLGNFAHNIIVKIPQRFHQLGTREKDLPEVAKDVWNQMTERVRLLMETLEEKDKETVKQRIIQEVQEKMPEVPAKKKAIQDLTRAA